MKKNDQDGVSFTDIGNKLHATNNKRESLATAYNFVLTIKKTNSRD